MYRMGIIAESLNHQEMLNDWRKYMSLDFFICKIISDVKCKSKFQC